MRVQVQMVCAVLFALGGQAAQGAQSGPVRTAVADQGKIALSCLPDDTTGAMRIRAQERQVVGAPATVVASIECIRQGERTVNSREIRCETAGMEPLANFDHSELIQFPNTMVVTWSCEPGNHGRARWAERL